MVRGVITHTVFDRNPYVIYAVSQVLFPPELFGPAPPPRPPLPS
ncbi:hypothetical protein A2U01_0089519, partial [Trifolium medium]|nr:hypothetical protein [Trifolium medium]